MCSIVYGLIADISDCAQSKKYLWWSWKIIVCAFTVEDSFSLTLDKAINCEANGSVWWKTHFSFVCRLVQHCQRAASFCSVAWLSFNISTCSGFSKVFNSPKVIFSPLVPVFAAPFPCPSFILRLSYELRAVMQLKKWLKRGNYELERLAHIMTPNPLQFSVRITCALNRVSICAESGGTPNLAYGSTIA